MRHRMAGVDAGLEDHLPVFGVDGFAVDGNLGHGGGMVAGDAGESTIDVATPTASSIASTRHARGRRCVVWRMPHPDSHWVDEGQQGRPARARGGLGLPCPWRSTLRWTDLCGLGARSVLR